MDRLGGRPPDAAAGTLALPPPDELGGPPVALALGRRRSTREFASRPLALREIGQLLWAAQGVTEPTRGLRTAPSAGAIYPLELDAVTPDGIFRYQPRTHALLRREAGDARPAVASAALSQACMMRAACVFALSVITGRVTGRYGARGERYAMMEAGHAAQNVLLQACALGLAGVPVGAFDDAALARALHCASDEEPLYLIALGAAK